VTIWNRFLTFFGRRSPREPRNSTGYVLKDIYPSARSQVKTRGFDHENLPREPVVEEKPKVEPNGSSLAPEGLFDPPDEFSLPTDAGVTRSAPLVSVQPGERPKPIRAEPEPEPEPVDGYLPPPDTGTEPAPPVPWEPDSDWLLDFLTKELVAIARELESEGESLVDRRLVWTLANLAERNELDLPSFPEVAMRVDQLARNPEVSLKDLAVVVDGDPELVRRVWVAASALGFSDPPKSVHHAVVRLGLTTVWQFAMDASLRAGRVEDFRWARTAEQIRQHAMVTGEVAGRLMGQPRGNAFLAGLLHDVGRLAVLRAVSQIAGRNRTPSQTTVDLLSDRVHPILGALLTRYWNLPEEIGAAVYFHHRWQDAPEEARELAHIVFLADLSAHTHRPMEQTLPIASPSMVEVEEIAEMHLPVEADLGAPDAEQAVLARELAEEAWARLMDQWSTN